jgi:hypothetical protein
MASRFELPEDPADFERTIYYILTARVKGPAWGEERDDEIDHKPESGVHRLAKVMCSVLRELKDKKILSTGQIEEMLHDCST